MRLDLQTENDVKAARLMERILLSLPQVELPITESLHQGVYCRTCQVPAGVTLTGCLLKVPTTLHVIGDCVLSVPGGKTIRVERYAVLETMAGRKTIFSTTSNTTLVMVFKTDAKTVAEARKEFTDDLLQGEYLCQEQQPLLGRWQQ